MTSVPTSEPTQAERKLDAVPVKTSDPVDKTPVRMVYLGVTIPGVVIRNKTYLDYPEKAKKMFKHAPLMKNLFVAPNDISQALVEIRHESGAFYEAYKAVAEYVKKLRERRAMR